MGESADAKDAIAIRVLLSRCGALECEKVGNRPRSATFFRLWQYNGVYSAQTVRRSAIFYEIERALTRKCPMGLSQAGRVSAIIEKKLQTGVEKLHFCKMVDFLMLRSAKRFRARAAKLDVGEPCEHGKLQGVK